MLIQTHDAPIRFLMTSLHPGLVLKITCDDEFQFINQIIFSVL